ncbi:hypothetical protein Leryth_008792 [Lithospermum erythrorhizon]|nr:hypothetical protein Leryth_008792 [Lithospermum erythrorhizon]
MVDVRLERNFAEPVVQSKEQEVQPLKHDVQVEVAGALPQNGAEFAGVRRAQREGGPTTTLGSPLGDD